MKISTTATTLALCLTLCACGETDDPAGQDAGSFAPPPDGGQAPRDSGGGGERDAAGDPGDRDAGGSGGQGDAAQQAPEDAGHTPADSGTGAQDASAPEDAGPSATTFTRVYEILSANCSPCHTSDSSGGLDMSSKATAYGELVGKAAEGPSCSGQGTRVVAGDADGSLLIRKLRPSPPCGSRMPRLRTPLSTTLIDEIADWIEAGAKND